ncbi:MAG: S24 family peptidase [candidate division WOR-3 bacterium]
MAKILTIKERILQYIDFKKYKKDDFFNSIGFLYSNFKGSNINSEIGSDKLVKILTYYNDINPEWLLTGKGPMLREQSVESQPVSIPAKPSDDKPLPLLPISAIAGLGNGELQVKEMDIEQWYPLLDFPAADFLITISGDSMLPTYKSGDIAICKRITHIYIILYWAGCM